MVLAASLALTIQVTGSAGQDAFGGLDSPVSLRFPTNLPKPRLPILDLDSGNFQPPTPGGETDFMAGKRTTLG